MKKNIFTAAVILLIFVINSQAQEEVSIDTLRTGTVKLNKSRNLRWTTGQTYIAPFVGYTWGDVKASTASLSLMRQYQFFNVTGEVGTQRSSIYGWNNYAIMSVGVNTPATKPFCGGLNLGVGGMQTPVELTYTATGTLTNLERDYHWRPVGEVSAWLRFNVTTRWAIVAKASYRHIFNESTTSKTSGDWTLAEVKNHPNRGVIEVGVAYNLSSTAAADTAAAEKQISGDKGLILSISGGYGSQGGLWSPEIGHHKRLNYNWGRYLGLGTTWSYDNGTFNEVFAKALAECYPIGSYSKIVLRGGALFGAGDYSHRVTTSTLDGSTLAKKSSDGIFGFSLRGVLEANLRLGYFNLFASGTVGGSWSSQTQVIDKTNLGYNKTQETPKSGLCWTAALGVSYTF